MRLSACGVSDVPVGDMENKECMALSLNRRRALLYRWLETHVADEVGYHT